MKAKIEITYDDGTGEVRSFGSTEAAIDFLRLCEARYQSERADRILGRSNASPDRPRLHSFQILP